MICNIVLRLLRDLGLLPLALLALTLAGPAKAEVVSLKVAHFMSPVAPLQRRVLEPWCQALAKDSGGRISCKIFPAMTIGNTPTQLVDTVKNGVADVI